MASSAPVSPLTLNDTTPGTSKLFSFDLTPRELVTPRVVDVSPALNGLLSSRHGSGASFRMNPQVGGDGLRSSRRGSGASFRTNPQAGGDGLRSSRRGSGTPSRTNRE
jgi:hypothetical protein